MEDSSAATAVLPDTPEWLLGLFSSHDFDHMVDESFTEADIHKNGAIDAEEVLVLLQRLLDDIARLLPEDQSGPALSRMTIEDARSALNQFDSDQDGVLNREEFREFLKLYMTMVVIANDEAYEIEHQHEHEEEGASENKDD